MGTVRLSLAGMALALLLAGLTSGNLVPALILLVPIGFASRLCARAPAYLGAYAAVALFGCWVITVGGLWLALFRGEALVGRFSPFEVAMSALILFFAGVGILRGVRAGRPLATNRRVLTVLLFAALQALALLGSVAAPSYTP